MRIAEAEFRQLDLEVHSILEQVPLHDVSAIDLPGGGEGRTLEEIRTILFPDDPSFVVRALFVIRSALGRVTGWDRQEHCDPGDRFIGRLSTDLIARSSVPVGTKDGPFRTLYLLDREQLSEIRNATVHAFSSLALVPSGSGYRLYWAIYVEPISWFTPIYMTAIEPFRRFIVYPSLLRRARQRWVAEFGSDQ